MGIQRSACLGIEIVCEYVKNLADGVMSVGIGVGWIKIDLDLVAGRVGLRCWLRDVFHGRSD